MRITASDIAAVVAAGLALTLPVTGALARDLPVHDHQGQITYITGGVGSTEAAAIEHVAKYFPLELKFMAHGTPWNEHPGSVTVRIKDTAHQRMLLNVKPDGPYLLAKLPAGIYIISAERNGRVENRDVHVSANEHQRVVFDWQL